MEFNKKFGKDAEFDFTNSDSKLGQRWLHEIDAFHKQIYDPNVILDDSQTQYGHGRIIVKDFQNSGEDFVLNVELSRQYPFVPPFIWIECPKLMIKSTKKPFKNFMGDLYFPELAIDWRPIFNLPKIFLLIYSTFNELCFIKKSDSKLITREETRNDALKYRFI